MGFSDGILVGWMVGCAVGILEGNVVDGVAETTLVGISLVTFAGTKVGAGGLSTEAGFS